MSKPTVIALYQIQPTISNYAYFLDNFNVVYYTLSTTEQFKADMQREPYKSALAIYGSYPGFAPVGGLHDKTVIDSLPPNLKIIGLCSAGYDGYDLTYLARRNIKVCNVPVDDEVAMDVADVALWHVLSGVRKLNNWDHKIHNSSSDQHTLKIRDEIRNEFITEEDDKESGFAFGHIFHGHPVRRASRKTCVVYGYGLIGKQVVKRMLAIDMRVNVLVKDKSKHSTNNTDPRISIYSSSIEADLLIATKNADVLVICLPGGKETNNIVSTETFQNISNDSIIVNVGRGSCVDTEALKVAIKSSKISHVGLDVFPNEPIIENYWFNETSTNKTSNKFFTSSITPHLGSSTLDTFEFASYSCIANIITALESNKFANVVNSL